MHEVKVTVSIENETCLLYEQQNFHYWSKKNKKVSPLAEKPGYNLLSAQRADQENLPYLK